MSNPDISLAFPLFEEEFMDDRDLFFDMDVTASSEMLHNDSISSSSTKEFEFAMGLSSLGSSPADHLFYKGKLLPLQLPHRLRMVEMLSSSSSRLSEGNELSFLPLSCSSQPNGSVSCHSIETHGHFNFSDVSKFAAFDKGADLHKFEGSMLDFCLERSKGVNDTNILPNCYKGDRNFLCKPTAEDDSMDEHVKMRPSSAFKWKKLSTTAKFSSLNDRGNNKCEKKLTERNAQKNWDKSKLMLRTLGKQKGPAVRKQKAAKVKEQIYSFDPWDRFDAECHGVMSKAKDRALKYLKVLKDASSSLLPKKTPEVACKQCNEYVKFGELKKATGMDKLFHRKRFDTARHCIRNYGLNADEKGNRMQLESAIQAAIAHCKRSQTCNGNIW